MGNCITKFIKSCGQTNIPQVDNSDRDCVIRQSTKCTLLEKDYLSFNLRKGATLTEFLDELYERQRKSNFESLSLKSSARPSNPNEGLIFVDNTTGDLTFYNKLEDKFQTFGDGGSISDTDEIQEGNSNLFFTEQRVASSPTITSLSDRIDSIPEGKSAYEVAFENDNSIGTEEQWLESLKGQEGDPGETPIINNLGNWEVAGTDTGVKAEGIDGNSPVINGSGNWELNGIDLGVQARGDDGDNGQSAYEVAFAQDNTIGTESEWIESLKGEDGSPDTPTDIVTKLNSITIEEDKLSTVSVKIEPIDSIEATNTQQALEVLSDRTKESNEKTIVSNYTVLEEDLNNTILICDNLTEITITVPTNFGTPKDQIISIYQKNTGDVRIEGLIAFINVGGRFKSVSLYKQGDDWIPFGGELALAPNLYTEQNSLNGFDNTDEGTTIQRNAGTLTSVTGNESSFALQHTAVNSPGNTGFEGFETIGLSLTPNTDYTITFNAIQLIGTDGRPNDWRGFSSTIIYQDFTDTWDTYTYNVTTDNTGDVILKFFSNPGLERLGQRVVVEKLEIREVQ